MKPTETLIKPMPAWESVLIFIIIAGSGLFSFYFIRPLLEQSGLSEYAAYLISLSVVLIVMLVWSYVAYILEGNPRTFGSFLKRTRLESLGPRWLAWSVGLGILMLLSTIVFSPFISQLISIGILPLPDGVPDYINPLRQMSLSEVKTQLISQGVVVLIPVVLFLNIFGEEVFWRGMVYPRQERKHGQKTFLIHGVIWAFAHLFQYWLILPILIGAIPLAYVVQRTKSTWIGIFAHAFNNALPLLAMAFVST